MKYTTPIKYCQHLNDMVDNLNINIYDFGVLFNGSMQKQQII